MARLAASLEASGLKSSGAKGEQSVLPPAAAGARSWDPSLPVEEIERVLGELWEATLRRSPIRRDDDFHSLSGPSCVAAELVAADLLMRVEARFGKRLRFSTFFDGGSTVAGMAQALIREQSAETDASPALVGLQTRGTQPPICWLPGGSGMSSIPYREVSRLLGADQPVYSLESPVVLDAPVDLRTRATSYVAALRAGLPPPYTLLGYSSGAWIALQMARQLSAEGAEVTRVVVFDAPVPRRLTARDRAAKAMQHLRWHLRRMRNEPLEELAGLGRGVERRLHRWITGRIPEEQNFPTGSLYDQVDRRIRAAILAFSREHHPKWDGRITLILGEQVDYPYLSGELDLRLGWRQIAGGGLDLIRVPSDHLSMLEGAEAQHLASELRRLLSAKP